MNTRIKALIITPIVIGAALGAFGVVHAITGVQAHVQITAPTLVVIPSPSASPTPTVQPAANPVTPAPASSDDQDAPATAQAAGQTESDTPDAVPAQTYTATAGGPVPTSAISHQTPDVPETNSNVQTYTATIQ